MDLQLLEIEYQEFINYLQFSSGKKMINKVFPEKFADLDLQYLIPFLDENELKLKHRLQLYCTLKGIHYKKCFPEIIQPFFLRFKFIVQKE